MALGKTEKWRIRRWLLIGHQSSFLVTRFPSALRWLGDRDGSSPSCVSYYKHPIALLYGLVSRLPSSLITHPYHTLYT